MPSRRNNGPRRGRRRTRWFSLVPHALTTFTANDTFENQLLEIQDREATWAWREFTGATILRTIIDFVFDPIPALPADGDDWQPIVHLGVLVSPIDSPGIGEHTPNNPHADFMWRATWSAEFYRRSGPLVIHKGNHLQADIRQARRIDENDRLWLVGHYFERLGGSGNGSCPVGLNGRVLIALP